MFEIGHASVAVNAGRGQTDWYNKPGVCLQILKVRT